MKKRKEKFVDSEYVFEIFEKGDTKLPKYKIAIIHYEGETKGQLERRLKKGILEGKVIEEYEVTTIVAHNARFDFGAINNTKKYLEEYPLLPYLEWYDSLKMARSVLGTMPTYERFCKDNNYLTKTGKCRFTAEIIYRYITRDNDFIENHTGLEDTLIEKEILAYCFKQHKKMDKLLFNK